MNTANEKKKSMYSIFGLVVLRTKRWVFVYCRLSSQTLPFFFCSLAYLFVFFFFCVCVLLFTSSSSFYFFFLCVCRLPLFFFFFLCLPLFVCLFCFVVFLFPSLLCAPEFPSGSLLRFFFFLSYGVVFVFSKVQVERRSVEFMYKKKKKETLEWKKRWLPL